MIKLKQFPLYPEGFLRKKSEPVKDAKEAQEIKQRLEDLFPRKGALAVAAIQIGVPKRASLIKFPGKDVFTFICNPEIIEQSEPKKFLKEGCLSFPGKAKNTIRYNKVKVKYQDVLLGELDERVLIADGIEAVILQHEIDHMNGILCKDHVTRIEPVRAERKVGRNQSCPCGSGKKFKKCCIGED